MFWDFGSHYLKASRRPSGQLLRQRQLQTQGRCGVPDVSTVLDNSASFASCSCLCTLALKAVRQVLFIQPLMYQCALTKELVGRCPDGECDKVNTTTCLSIAHSPGAKQGCSSRSSFFILYRPCTQKKFTANFQVWPLRASARALPMAIVFHGGSGPTSRTYARVSPCSKNAVWSNSVLWKWPQPLKFSIRVVDVIRKQTGKRLLSLLCPCPSTQDSDTAVDGWVSGGDPYVASFLVAVFVVTARS